LLLLLLLLLRLLGLQDTGVGHANTPVGSLSLELLSLSLLFGFLHLDDGLRSDEVRRHTAAWLAS
jgi:hypothetical protein